ncbi:unnamed protein product [Heterobilharzia americana]|nr:unnamed protein product [Heterobilharzia americana]
MSRADDLYPGTTERVCLIVGTLEACMQLHDYVMKKISERPQNVAIIGTAGVNCVERHKQVKILVPDTTAGIIIGKRGNFIEKIKQESHAFVQVSQRPKDIKLFERCVVITGEFDERKIAVEMVMRKILEDPDSACYSNCSYSQVREPIASAFSSGSPFAMMYTPRLDMNGSNLDFNNNLENPLPNFPDTGLPTVTNQFLREDKLTKNQIDPFHYNRPLRLPLVGIDPYSGISVIPSTGQPLIFGNNNQTGNLPSCNTVGRPFMIPPNLIDQSKFVSPDLTSNQIMILKRPVYYSNTMPHTCSIQNGIPQSLVGLDEKVTMTSTFVCANQPASYTTTTNDSYSFLPSSQQDDKCTTTMGNEMEFGVPIITCGNTIPSHSRYLSGESVDSALTESVLSVRLQSSTEDFMTDPFQKQQQQQIFHWQPTLSRVQAILSPNSLYSVCSSTQKSECSLRDSNQNLLNDPQKLNCQTSLIMNERNDNYNRFPSNENQSRELAYLSTGCYGPGVGGVLLVGTTQQLHDALHLLNLEGKQQYISLTPGTIITPTGQIGKLFNSSYPSSSLRQIITAPLSVCNDNAGISAYTTSFSSGVPLKLDTIQPLSMPKHLVPLSLHLPVNQY